MDIMNTTPEQWAAEDAAQATHAEGMEALERLARRLADVRAAVLAGALINTDAAASLERAAQDLHLPVVRLYRSAMRHQK